MTPKLLLDALLPLMMDLSRELPDSERYRRLLDTLRMLFPCDAAAFLRIDGDVLVPLAITGMLSNTMERRFRINEHARFRAMLSNIPPTRFPPNSSLPDPYEGLLQARNGESAIRDCLGVQVTMNGRPWGLLTLDALGQTSFDGVDIGALQSFASLAAATVSAAEQLHSLAEASAQERARAEVYRLASNRSQRELLGQSAVHKRMLKEIRLLASSNVTVLISGEIGVGKKLVANAIHAASLRARKPFISIDCVTLPETQADSELFGHVRGAFPGAAGDRRGKFELADGGTLFLDEVGALPLPVQSKLLQVLQRGQIQRVGSDNEHKVDVRVIATSHRNLAEEVRQGRFRADLFNRMSVYSLAVPPLRERGQDILLMAEYFLEENRSRLGLQGLRLALEAQQALLGYSWPGNVRELEYLITRSVHKALGQHAERPSTLLLSETDLGLMSENRDRALPETDVPTGDTPDAPNETLAPPLQNELDLTTGYTLREAVDAYERQLITSCLARHGGNVASASRELGLDRANLNRLARRLGLK